MRKRIKRTAVLLLAGAIVCTGMTRWPGVLWAEVQAVNADITENGQESLESNAGTTGNPQDGPESNAGTTGNLQDGPENEAGTTGNLQDSPENEAGTTGNLQDGPENEAGTTGNPQESSGNDAGQESGAADPSDPENGEKAGSDQNVRQPGQVTANTDKKAEGRAFAGIDEETGEWIDMAGQELVRIASDREIMALVYLSDEYPVRLEPSYESDTVVTVLSGQMVYILDIYVDENFEVWEYVKLEYKGQQVYGYIPRTYLACSDSRFLEWEELYGMNPGAGTYSIDAETGVYADIEQFPESYRPALLALKEKHPNWIFAKMNTTLDWEEVVYHELQNSKSLAYYTLPDWAREGLYDSKNWYFASEAALKLYLDPRNGLTEDRIFQFELLLYNEEYHTEQAVTDFLNNTFMNNSTPAPGTDMTYASIFWSAATKVCKVSPFHLVARVVQEQGKGDSALISGTYPGYEGYYNYFNVKASGTTNQQVIENGLKHAKNQGWNNAYNAIVGGADFISSNYITKGQDTLYLQKYNVNPDGYYKVYEHQYMQNISAATTEASNIKKLYERANALENSFVFKIPVYENMPAEPCTAPAASTNVYLSLPKGYSGITTMWLDGVPYEGVIRNGSLIAAAPDGNARTAVMYKYNESGVPTGMYVWSLGYSGTAYSVTPEPGLEDLLTYHGFSIRITGKSGLRCKTGMSSDLRNTLTSSGVNGYTLKEYGTLIMNNANRSQFPMIKGGQKVVASMAYGFDTSGNFQDVVFETVEGRYRYTSVLVGIPADQYKTEYAFRGYAVLEKNGVETVVYGPVVPRSIYALAQQLIERGSYESGTDAYVFLQNLISDAEAAAAQAAGANAG